MEKIIQVSNLTKSFSVPVKQGFFKSIFIPKNRQVTAVKDISFSVNEGESVALLGPNGAGKTTTLKMLTGLLYPTTGDISVLGFKPVEREVEYLKQIALVMGNKNGLSWDLSANQSYSLLEAIYGLEKAQTLKTVNELSEMLSVSSNLDTPIRKLSLGQRLKMELIGSILHEPKVLFLDEPTIGLDVVAKKSIRDFLRKINQEQGCTIILTSHDMTDIEKVCDRCIIINHGTVAFDDSLLKLNQKYQSKKYLTLEFSEKIPEERISKYGRIVDKKSFSYTIEIQAKDQAKIISGITTNLPLEDIDIAHVPLDEIMADIFKRQV